MRLADFEFELPGHLIADRPTVPRDRARLLVVGDGLRHGHVSDLPSLLAPGDILVMNDTKVIPARLAGRRGGAAVQVTLHRREGPALWRAFARPAKRLRLGDRIDFAPGFAATLVGRHEVEGLLLQFEGSDADLLRALDSHGAMPLPPYIKRPVDDRDLGDYQTVYGAAPGAVAAPTAGLHFTPELLAALAASGISRAMVTLHVGAGTFLPVRQDDPSAHVLLAEWGEVSPRAADQINAARALGGRVVAVGTTSTRLLEAAADGESQVRPFAGETDLFILPGYRFRVVDLLLTNFHLPRSTLFMLVAAFAGLEPMRRAYGEAIELGYRFYSYGDCCLLKRRDARP
jgi:S-adenosylmethionine:tRNA ribosyltransferase-isomerase